MMRLPTMLFFAFFVMIASCTKVFATTFTDLKFGRSQIADSQWNVSACMYTNTCQIYSTQPGTMYQIPWFNGQWNWQTGQYVQFNMTGNATNPYEAKVYNSNGSVAGVIGTGRIINMGTDSSGKSLFFFVGNDNNTGQLFSTNYGLTGTSGYTWTGTLNPTIAQVNTFSSTGSTTPLAAGQTVSAPSTPTVTGTSVTYTTRTVNSGNTTYVYRTPVTTTSYSDGTSTSSNGSESLYQTKVASTVTTNKVQNGVLTTYNTPINTVTPADGSATFVESNGAVIATTQSVQTGLNFKVWRYDIHNYSCGWLGCVKIPFSYRTPSTNSTDYGNPVNSGITGNGMYLQTNARLPNNDGSWFDYNDGTVIQYTGTITAPVTTARPAGTVYRIYFYNNTDDGFVLRINGQTIINQNSTYTWQVIWGYTSNGWMDVVAGQTYSLEAWYWNVLGGVGHQFYWDYGDGIRTVTNSAFTTGNISSFTIDTSGVSYSNTSVVNVSGTAVTLGPTIEGGTITQTNAPGNQIITSGSAAATNLTPDQQSRINNWTGAGPRPSANSIGIDVNGANNNIYIEQVGNSNLVTGIGESTARVIGSDNTVTVRQGTTAPGQNEIQMRISGDGNTLEVGQARTNTGVQTGTNAHYQAVDINGFQNNVVTQQSNVTLGSHYQETTINGNQNNVTARQTDNGNKIMFNTVNGNNNTVDVVQKDGGQHQLTNRLTGNNHSVTVVQEGAQQNKANIDLVNSGGAAALDLLQSGGMNFTIQQSCTNPAGCTTTVRQ